METIVWMEEYLARAEEMIFNGNVREGMNIAEGLLYEEPGYGRLHNFLGWAYMYYANDAAQAEMHFTMAMRFAPEYAPAYLHMGNLLNRAGRYAEAIDYFRLGLTKPEALHTTLLEGMAVAYEMTRDYRLAIRAYKEAAIASVADYEVARMLSAVKRCRKKRVTLMFSFW